MDWSSWIIAAISLLAGCWIQTALGFGMAVLAAPIIVIFKPEWVPVVLTFTALILSIMNTWNQRHDMQLHTLSIAFVTRIPGTVLGAWLLLQLNVQALQIFVAVCVLSAVVISYSGKQFDYTPGRLGIAAFVSGVVGTTTSVGGPPMALVMQHGSPKNVRANLSIYFAYSCALSLVSYGLTDQLNAELIWISLSFIPISIIGFQLGTRTRPYVDAGRFRPLLLGFCSVAGIFALIGALY